MDKKKEPKMGRDVTTSTYVGIPMYLRRLTNEKERGNRSLLTGGSLECSLGAHWCSLGAHWRRREREEETERERERERGG